MLSIIIPINHKDRVGQLNTLYKKIKEEAGLPVEVVVACDNPAIYDSLKSDVLVRIPKRVEFTQSVNIAEKFATNKVVWYMDDSVTPVIGWAKKAWDAFWNRFPDGRGFIEISGANNCATRGLTTRQFAYELNGNTLLWPEYLHCGDAEFFERTTPDKFYPLEEVLLIEKKINDESRLRNTKVFAFDDKIRDLRRSQNFPKTFQSNYNQLLLDYCRENDLMDLYNNLI